MEWLFYRKESTKVIPIECFNVHRNMICRSKILSVRPGPVRTVQKNSRTFRSGPFDLPDRASLLYHQL